MIHLWESLFEAYKSEETADEIIAVIRTSRVSNRNTELAKEHLQQLYEPIPKLIRTILLIRQGLSLQPWILHNNILSDNEGKYFN